jgi:hypothetical protein
VDTVSYFFDELHKQNPNFYTGHPLLSMDEKELKKLAKENGFDDVQAFLMYALQSSEQMSCPACGVPQNHLSDCKGCGSGAYSSWDVVEAYGEDAPARIKAGLEDVVQRHKPDIAEYVANNAYDCMVCTSCWQEAIATSQSYRYCPLKLFSDRILTGSIVQGLLYLGNADLAMQSLKQGVAQWLQDPAKAAWRNVIYHVALSSER